MNLQDVVALLPEMVLAAAALAVLMIDLVIPPERRRWVAWASLIGVAAALVANAFLTPHDGALVQGMIRADRLAIFLNFILLLGCGLALALSVDYLERQGIARGEYYALILFSTLGAMLMGASADLLMVFLGLETLSIPLYILSAFLTRRTASQEAGLKYFLIGSFSSGLFLYGIALMYGATGTTQLDALAQALSGSLAARPLLVFSGAGLLLVGLGFKAAAVPFHTWAPDVYEGAPTSTVAFMAVAAKAAAFAALLRVFAISFPALAENWSIFVAALAVLTMVLGNVVAVVQLNLKRLLAYSSIAHAGYLLVAVAAAQTPQTMGLAISSLLFYLLVYTFMTLGAFGIVILAEGKGENLSLEDLSGIASRHPWMGAAMALFMLSLAGLPPAAGFFGKFYVFSAAVQADMLWLAVVGVLASVVSVYYYFRVVYYMVMRPLRSGRAFYLSRAAGIGIGIAVVGVILLGIYPTVAWGWLGEVVAAAAP